MKPIPAIKYSIRRMQCTACGAEANASCNCGKPYVPKEAAKEAIKANPEKSNRTIAGEIGTSEKTVRKARTELGAEGSAPERRGADGKTYPVKKPDPLEERDRKEAEPPSSADRAEARCAAQWKAFKAQEERNDVEIMPTEEEADESWQNDLYDQACLLLERMADKTRRRFFAEIRKVYGR
jgi:hypothetical protein